jgi:hypothetical protein
MKTIKNSNENLVVIFDYFETNSHCVLVLEFCETNLID